MLEVSGSPLKFLQGHNLFGSSDLRGLVCAVGERVAEALDIPLDDRVRGWWDAGLVRLTRVDCTEMLEFPTRADCRAVARHAASWARGRHSPAKAYGETVYFGIGSRYHVTKMYVKADELECRRKGHALAIHGEWGQRLAEWAENKLRLELMLRARELDREGLGTSGAWSGATCLRQLREKLGGIQMGRLTELPSAMLSHLPGRLVSAYRAWEHGDDLRALYSHNTYYRYRRQLLEHGIDISIRRPVAPKAPSVLEPLSALLDRHLAGVPEWAPGTPLHFEPASRGRPLAGAA